MCKTIIWAEYRHETKAVNFNLFDPRPICKKGGIKNDIFFVIVQKPVQNGIRNDYKNYLILIFFFSKLVKGEAKQGWLLSFNTQTQNKNLSKYSQVSMMHLGLPIPGSKHSFLVDRQRYRWFHWRCPSPCKSLHPFRFPSPFINFEKKLNRSKVEGVKVYRFHSVFKIKIKNTN